jgi:hypothetical protein
MDFFLRVVSLIISLVYFGTLCVCVCVCVCVRAHQSVKSVRRKLLDFSHAIRRLNNYFIETLLAKHLLGSNFVIITMTYA